MLGRTRALPALADGEEVADRTGEAIEADHDQGLAGADVAQQARQHRPGATGAQGALLGGHPRIADQAA